MLFIFALVWSDSGLSFFPRFCRSALKGKGPPLNFLRRVVTYSDIVPPSVIFQFGNFKNSLSLSLHRVRSTTFNCKHGWAETSTSTFYSTVQNRRVVPARQFADVGRDPDHHSLTDQPTDDRRRVLPVIISPTTECLFTIVRLLDSDFLSSYCKGKEKQQRSILLWNCYAKKRLVVTLCGCCEGSYTTLFPRIEPQGYFNLSVRRL